MSGAARLFEQTFARASALLLATTLACMPARVSGRVAGAPASGGAGGAHAAAPSLFELDFPMTDAQGRGRRLSELRGHTIVASMFYTHCSSTCPRVTADLEALDRALPCRVRERTR